MTVVVSVLACTERSGLRRFIAACDPACAGCADNGMVDDAVLFAAPIDINKAGVGFRMTLTISAGESESAKADEEK